MLDRRVVYKRRASYRTASNRFRTVKTPGGKLAVKYIQKRGKSLHHGIKAVRGSGVRKVAYRQRTVSRPYGGVLTHDEVKERITRAFMIEEIQSIKQKASATEKKSKKKRSNKTKK